MRRFFFMLASLLLLAAAQPTMAAGISVAIDEGKIVSFDAAIATVYVGNPSMADVTVINSHRMFVMGKTFGRTNLIALDRSGKTVFNGSLVVMGQRKEMVTLNLGMAQESYACVQSRCEMTEVPGDAKQFFDQFHSETTTHEGYAESAAAPH